MKIINNFPKITKLDNIENELTHKAPIDHASSETIYGISTSVNYGHVKLSDSYTSSDGTADSAVAASSKAVSDAYNKLNNNLETGLPVTYYYLSNGEEGHCGDIVTTTKRLCSTMIVNGVNRKFSDYDYLCFELLINSNSVRASIVIPRTRFTNHKYSVELTYVDSTNTQRWVNVAYNSDTSFYLQGSSNILADTRVQISGMMAMLRSAIVY